MIRFGLLGSGRIAKRHSELLGGNDIDGASLVAVCDPICARADAIALKFGVPAYYDIDDFLAPKDIDAVAVLTPSGMHPQHVIACARAAKYIVVEKPMALLLQDTDEMMRACGEAGVKLFVVKQNRFNVPVVKAREALEAGRFGRLILGTVRVRWCRDHAYYDQDDWRGTWAYDGGVLSNQLPFLAAYSRFGHRTEQFPNAYHQQSGILSLPMFAEITRDQQEEVINLIRAF